jgi:hypothetical protein
VAVACYDRTLALDTTMVNAHNNKIFDQPLFRAGNSESGGHTCQQRTKHGTSVVVLVGIYSMFN